MTGYRVLVKPDPIVTKTAGGIEIPVNEKLEKTGVQRGVVIDVGPFAWKAFRELNDAGNERSGVKWAQPGDYIFFARNAGRFIFDPFEPEEDNQNEYLVMNDEDIIAVIAQGDNPKFDNNVQKEARRTY